MNLETLKVFVAVMRHGSFAAAARAQGSDPSQVSRAVAGLEAELGVRLFHRSTRQMTLTEAGELYGSRVEAALDELDDAAEGARSLDGAPRGTLRLTASTAYGQTRLMPLLPAFRRRHPEIGLDLVLTDAQLDLVAHRIDLALRLTRSEAAEDVCLPLHPTTYRICAPPDLARKLGPITPGELAGVDVLIQDLPGYRSVWRFRLDQLAPVLEVPIRGSLRFSTALALKDAMLAGLGPALVADWLVAAEMKAGACVDLMPDWQVTATDFDTGAWLIFPHRRMVPARTRAAVAFLQKHLGAR